MEGRLSKPRICPQIDIETLAKQQGVKPIRTREDLYRYSVRDDEDLDAWLNDLARLRSDQAPSPTRKS